MSKRPRLDVLAHSSSRGKYTALTPELFRWLPSAIEVKELDASRRPGRLLAYFDFGSKGYKEVVQTCQSTARWSEKECDAYLRDHASEVEDGWKPSTLDEKRWTIIVVRLGQLLPTVIEEPADVQLMRMAPDAAESLGHFVGDFRRKATELIAAKKIEETRAAVIFVSKLPQSLRGLVELACIGERSLIKAVETTIAVLQWEADVMPFGPPMDATPATNEPTTLRSSSVKSKLMDGNNIKYDLIKSPNHIIILAKHLMDRNLRFRREVWRHFKTYGPEWKLVPGEAKGDGRSQKVEYLTSDARADDVVDEGDLQFYPLGLGLTPRSLIRFPVELMGVKVDAVVSEGAACNFVQKSLLEAVGLVDDVTPTHGTLYLPDGSVALTHGKLTLSLIIDGRERHADAFVLQGNGSPLILSMDFMDKGDSIVYPKKRMLIDTKDVDAISTDAAIVQRHLTKTMFEYEDALPPGQW